MGVAEWGRAAVGPVVVAGGREGWLRPFLLRIYTIQPSSVCFYSCVAAVVPSQERGGGVVCVCDGNREH